MELKGARALVSGGATRVGAALALGLAAEGADVAIGYHHSEAQARETCTRIEAAGVRSHAVSGDVGDPAQAAALVREAAAALGGLELYVHAASGGFRPIDPAKLDEQAFDEAVDSTLKGGFFCAQAARAAMGEAGGLIVNITDVAGLEPWPAFAAHGAAKAGLSYLTRTLARAWAPSVRVNAIAPGTVLVPEGSSAESVRRRAQGTALGRIGTPGDVLEALLYLVRADYVTGVELVVDGGRRLL